MQTLTDVAEIALMPSLRRPKNLIIRTDGTAIPLWDGAIGHSGGRGRHGSDGNLISIESPIATLPPLRTTAITAHRNCGRSRLLDDHLPLEADLEAVDQGARRSQAGKLDHGLRSELKDRSPAASSRGPDLPNMLRLPAGASGAYSTSSMTLRVSGSTSITRSPE